MFNFFFKKSKKQTKTRGGEPVDTSRFSDPKADQTEWTPLITDGSNFHARRLVEVQEEKIEYRVSRGTVKLCIVVYSIGLLSVLVSAYSMYRDGLLEPVNVIFSLLFVFFWGVPGAIILKGLASASIVFNREKGYFWKKGWQPVDQHEINSKKNTLWLSKIYAIQLISGDMEGQNSIYPCFELNLVLEDSARVSINYHLKLGQINEEALMLAKFLGVPIWNGIPPGDVCRANR